MEASYLQRRDLDYIHLDTFPQYEIFEPFVDWEIKDGYCNKKQIEIKSQCVERTLQYIKIFSMPWDFNSLEIRNAIEPNLFSHVFANQFSEGSAFSENKDEVNRVFGWLKEFPMQKLAEKIHNIKKLIELQGKHHVLKFSVNQKALIIVGVSSRNWTVDTICLISLLLSTKVCTTFNFEFGWQEEEGVSDHYKI